MASFEARSRRRAHARQRFETSLKRAWPQRAEASRRRAHARQRFETSTEAGDDSSHLLVGEELMRDSALKHAAHQRLVSFDARRRRAHARQRFETRRCIRKYGAQPAQCRRRAHARQRFETQRRLGLPLARGYRRRRAHARQRFETISAPTPTTNTTSRRRAHARQRFETSS